jgi:hypothetical protein
MSDYNRHTGEVAFPEAGESVVIQFTVEAFEKLQSAYGDDYIDIITKGLSKMHVKVYQTTLAATMRNGDVSLMPFGLKYEVINIRILDAMNLAIYGRDYQEQKDWQEEQVLKRLEGAGENPTMAAILSLLSAGKQEPEQG